MWRTYIHINALRTLLIKLYPSGQFLWSPKANQDLFLQKKISTGITWWAKSGWLRSTKDKINTLQEKTRFPNSRTWSLQSCLTLSDSRDCSPGSSVHGISRQECWSELPFPTPGGLLGLGIQPMPPVSPALAGGFLTPEPPGYGHFHFIC